MQKVSCGFVVAIALLIPAGAQGGFIYVSGTGANPGFYQSLETGRTFTDAITTQYNATMRNYQASGLGVSIVTGAVDTLLYNVPLNYDGLPFNCKLYVSATQVGMLTVTSPYGGAQAELHRLDSTYSFQIVNGSSNLTAVPEPSTFVLAFLAGSAAIVTGTRWRRSLPGVTRCVVVSQLPIRHS